MKQFLRLLRYALPYRTAILLSLICMGLGALLSVVSIGALQPIFDLLLSQPGESSSLSLPGPLKNLFGEQLASARRLLATHRLSVLSYLCVALLILFLVKGLLTYGYQYLMHYVAEGMMKDVRDQLHAHLHTLSLRFFSRHATGQVMSRLTFDVDLLGKTVTVFFANAVKEPVYILGFLTLLFFIKWQLALLSLVVFPIAVYLIATFGNKIRFSSGKVQESRAELNSLLQETLSGIRVVKAFGMEGYEKERFIAKSREIFKQNLRIAKVNTFSSPVLEVMGAVGVVGGFWLGAFLVIEKVLTPGELMVFLGALASLYQPLKRCSQVNNNIQRGMAGVKRVFEVLDMEPDIAEAPGAVDVPRMRERIAFRDVSFCYDGDSYILRGISFDTKLGEVIAIVGESGVGKTTLVNLLPRFYDPGSGLIEIDGVDIRKATLKSLREQMGIVTQDTILFDDTVLRNIAYGRRGIPKALVYRAAEAANALEFIEKLPQGFETRIGERGARLSGGERQRIAIARAILKDPPILILDEATSALDAESERLVQEALERLMQDRTTFVIAHRLSTIIRADRILVLEEGRIVEMATHAELISKGGVYCRLYQSEFAGVSGGGWNQNAF